MALRLGGKVDRVIRFLMGVNQPRIAGTLVAHGFSQKDLDEGWQRLRAVAGERINAPPAPPRDLAAIEWLDAWENKWFPIVDATLAHRYPRIRGEVFLNLSQTEGPEVAISVAAIIQRITALGQGDAEHKAARELLRQRGLTDQNLAEAAKQLERVGQVMEPPAVDIEALQALQKEKEDAMWAWYLEWSTIARAVIKDGRLLQQLGFRLRRRAGVEEVVEDGEGVEEVPPPAPQVGAGDGAGAAPAVG